MSIKLEKRETCPELFYVPFLIMAKRQSAIPIWMTRWKCSLKGKGKKKKMETMGAKYINFKYLFCGGTSHMAVLHFSF